MKPEITVKEVLSLIAPFLPKIKDYPLEKSVIVVGLRGYLNIGKPGNDRGIYDDALAIIAPEFYDTYQANVDPSAFREGIATLAEGVHIYKKGLHGISKGNPYPAFIPAAPGKVVTVFRDGKPGPTTGIALNMHEGGVNGTSSLGCTTLPKGEPWRKYYADLDGQLRIWKQETFPYIVIKVK